MCQSRKYTITDFSLEQEELLRYETLFHNSNGYIGIRGCFEEGYPAGFISIRGEYINAFYDYAEMKQAEKLYGLTEDKQTIVNTADTQSVRICLAGETFSMFTGKVIACSRTIDMDKGISVREVDWESPRGRKTRLKFERMTSFVHLPLFLIACTVTPLNYEGTIVFATEHNGSVSNHCDANDPRVADEGRKYLRVERISMEGDVSCILSRTGKSELSLCTAVAHRVAGSLLKKEYGRENDCVKGSVTVEGRKGEACTLYQYAVFSDSVRYPDVVENCRKEMTKVLSMPAESLYREQEEYLSAFWENSVLKIDGDEELDMAVNFNMYQLLQSVGKDPFSHIPAKGLSGEGYEGHFFWDAEMYILPYFVLTNPHFARNCLAFRYKILPFARKNARLLGHSKGALYPWRTINGTECSGYFPSGTAQYHISGAVAYAVVQYYLVTKDLDFIREMGAEMLVETARLWYQTGVYTEAGFEIHEVTGPDEYTCLVDNNYYTNALAKYNMEWAVRILDTLEEADRDAILAKLDLTEEETAGFADAALHMYLPFDEKLGINPQDDSFLHKKKWDLEGTPGKDFPLLLHYHPLTLYRHQICKQADTVLSHFILEDYQSEEVIRRSFEYYEKITTHDSSLSTCIFSIVASRLGLVKKACAYFGESAKLDLFDTHKNTKDGIHTANMGGNYMAIVYGFAGLRIKESGIFFSPLLPAGWNGYHFILRYEDGRILVEVDKDHTTFRLLSGLEKELTVYGRALGLKDELTVPLKKGG